MLYDEIGGWWGATAEDFIAELQQVTAPNLRVRINSPGGSVFEGIAIANAIRSFAGTVTCQVDGIAASIASVIAMAADRVEMAPQTMMMIHDASGLCYGDAADMEEMGVLLDLLSDNIADAYAARAGGTREQWRDLMRAESWYLPDDAVEAGLADEAILTPKSGEPVAEPVEPDDDELEPEMRREFDFAAYGYQGPKQAEAPKPAPPAAEQAVTLTFPVGSAIDETLLFALRAAVEQRGEPVEEAAPQTADDTADAGPPAVAEEPPAEPAAEDEWTAETAHLTQADPWAQNVAHLTQGDAWSALVSNLTEPDTSSSATAA
jgi:ATP-dependent protease ClpP protease subunit